MNRWKGKNVLVLGAARQGLAAARFLARQQAHVMLNDKRSAAQFSQSIAELEQSNIAHWFGGHPLELLQDMDAVCVSGGVPLENPLVQQAQRSGIPLTNDSQIFMEIVRARVIGITGSAGKTTTTILLGEITKQAVKPGQRVWVGGNIGCPMLVHVDQIQADDWVILELSSFQLELMTKSPQIAVFLNITPNHLDRHKTMQNYLAAKSHILQFQGKADIAILNHEDRYFPEIKKLVKGRLITFGLNPPSGNKQAIFREKRMVVMQDGKINLPLMDLNYLRLPGEHNQMNMLAACAAGIAAGFPVESLYAGIEQVNNIPHRLELVREHRGVRWINDSIATAPERVVAALHAIQPPLILLLGGRDKDLPWEDLADRLHAIQPCVILFGEAANLIHAAIQRYENGRIPYRVYRKANLEEAVHQAAKISQSGDTVLLSPGGTSYDAYMDFEERGRHFKQLAEAVL